MALIKAKCTSCGASLKIDNYSKTGVCSHCGATYITEDVVVNNITNINVNENIDGVKLNRAAVLENLLVKYYAGEYDDVDNMKEYALKVQETDLNNALANFIVFKNIDSVRDIRKLLGDHNLNIGLDLFITFLSVCGCETIDSKVIQNIKKYSSDTDNITIIKGLIDNYKRVDINLYNIYNVMYNLKLTESENTEILDDLYNKERFSKISILSQLKLFKSKHPDFMYDEQKFNGYAEHWKQVKEKQLALKEKNKVKEEPEDGSFEALEKVEKIVAKKFFRKPMITFFTVFGLMLAIMILCIILM